jgi:hypothetical protein
MAREMGTSLINIDRAYGHLACDSSQHAIRLLDDYSLAWRSVDAGGRPADATLRSGRSPPRQI